MKTCLAIAFVLVAACGGKKAPTPKAGGEEHAKMAPEIQKFHDVLAPRWHADKGPQRMTDTCGAMPDFQSGAAAIANSQMPAGANSGAWTSSTKELTEAVAALDGTCKAADAAAFEPAFERVHHGFHAVMELGGGEHGEEHHH